MTLGDFQALKIWTVRGEGEEREKISEITEEEGREVGWWFGDGDEIIVDCT